MPMVWALHLWKRWGGIRVVHWTDALAVALEAQSVSVYHRNHRLSSSHFWKICLAHGKDTSFFTVRFVKVFLKASSAGALTFELFEAVSQWFDVVCMIPDPTGLPINRLPKQDVKRTVGPLACLNMWTPIRTSAILPTGNETIWYYICSRGSWERVAWSSAQSASASNDSGFGWFWQSPISVKIVDQAKLVSFIIFQEHPRLDQIL